MRWIRTCVQRINASVSNMKTGASRQPKGFELATRGSKQSMVAGEKQRAVTLQGFARNILDVKVERAQQELHADQHR
jgi:hypothetical protein